MLSYQHAFHAGNHADILKHFVLANVIKYMNKKAKPYTFFDTHSGSGIYKIDDARAKKTGEIESGILRLLNDFSKTDARFSEEAEKQKSNGYLKDEGILSKSDSQVFGNGENGGRSDGQMDFGLECFLPYIKTYIDKGEYPGSPVIEADFLRECDFLVLSELHPQEFENLKSNMKNRKYSKCQIQIHKRNGFEMLCSLTPPKTKRGVVLIDPSYEEKSDYSDVADCVLRTFKKWSGGVFLVWYPLLSYRMGMIEAMVDRISEGIHAISPNTDLNDFRLCVQEEDAHIETSLENTESPRLFGSGMLVVNPPWTLEKTMKETLPVLEKALRLKMD